MTTQQVHPEATGPYHDVETDHEYDGIREFDNPLPRWWLVTLWGAVAFAIVYWVWYQQMAGTGSQKAFAMDYVEYQKQLMAASVSEEELVQMSQDSAVVSEGATLFQENCRSCHGDKAQGQVGPNLTDGYWIHGGAPKDIYTTVGQGVPNTAMQSWLTVLGPNKMQKVVAWVLSVRNTNVPGRAPEGKPVE